MSRVYTDTIEPRKPTQDITLGTAGETISVGANSINVNTVADKGGNTFWTSDGSGNLSSINAGLKGNLVLLTTNTVTGGSSSAFTTKIDSTYDVYIFKFININPVTDGAEFTFNGSTDGGSNYNTIKTSTYFYAYHDETVGNSGLFYRAAGDLAQNTAYQQIMGYPGNAADEGSCGELYLFNPSSTTYVKHFYFVGQEYHGGDIANNEFIAGYLNLATAVNAIDFKPASGNFDGIIKMYGLL